MNPYVILVFDVVILAALGATILYAWKLSRQLREMQTDRKPFEKLIESLNNAASRADAATRALKEAATRDGGRLQEKLSAARGFADELEIVIQAGDSLARRLETLAVRTSRGPDPRQEEQAPSPQPLRDALARRAALIEDEETFEQDEEQREERRGPAHHRAQSEQPRRAYTEQTGDRPVRTRAEKELLEALRAKQRSS